MEQIDYIKANSPYGTHTITHLSKEYERGALWGLNNQQWHKCAPRRNGTYYCALQNTKDESKSYCMLDYFNGVWFYAGESVVYDSKDVIVAWTKLPEYTPDDIIYE